MAKPEEFPRPGDEKSEFSGEWSTAEKGKGAMFTKETVARMEEAGKRAEAEAEKEAREFEEKIERDIRQRIKEAKPGTVEAVIGAMDLTDFINRKDLKKKGGSDERLTKRLSELESESNMLQRVKVFVEMDKPEGQKASIAEVLDRTGIIIKSLSGEEKLDRKQEEELTTAQKLQLRLHDEARRAQ